MHSVQTTHMKQHAVTADPTQLFSEVCGPSAKFNEKFDPSRPSHHEDEMLLLDTNTDVRIIRRGVFL
jgi:hypothetical protein